MSSDDRGDEDEEPAAGQGEELGGHDPQVGPVAGAAHQDPDGQVGDAADAEGLGERADALAPAEPAPLDPPEPDGARTDLPDREGHEAHRRDGEQDPPEDPAAGDDRDGAALVDGRHRAECGEGAREPGQQEVHDPVGDEAGAAEQLRPVARGVVPVGVGRVRQPAGCGRDRPRRDRHGPVLYLGRPITTVL